MPEGPSILILKESVAAFKGKKIIAVSGNTNIGKDRLLDQKVLDFKTWGKHFLICFKSFSLRVHLMLFGSYRINERREGVPRLSLVFPNGELNFYTCSLKFIEEPLDTVYDWSADVLSDQWNPRKATQNLKEQPERLVCDALLDQNIFAGVGNIIKNEVLFRIRVHPLSRVGALPPAKRSELVREARNYSFDFLNWKRKFELKKHWLAYNKKICPRCQIPLHRKDLGKNKRRTFFCANCQQLYE